MFVDTQCQIVWSCFSTLVEGVNTFFYNDFGLYRRYFLWITMINFLFLYSIWVLALLNLFILPLMNQIIFPSLLLLPEGKWIVLIVVILHCFPKVSKLAAFLFRIVLLKIFPFHWKSLVTNALVDTISPIPMQWACKFKSLFWFYSSHHGIIAESQNDFLFRRSAN